MDKRISELSGEEGKVAVLGTPLTDACENKLSKERLVSEKAIKMSRWMLFVPELLQSGIWPLVQLTFRSFFSYKISGLENCRLAKEGNLGVLFAANHASELDPIFVRAAMPFATSYTPLFYVARGRGHYDHIRSLRKHFYGGLFFRCWGAYPAYSGLESYGESLKNHIRLIKKGKSVLIFPEGRMTRSGEIGPARGGTAFLSHEIGAPIIPVSVTGAYNLSWKVPFFRRKTIRVHFGKPLYAKDLFSEEQMKRKLAREEYRQAAERVLSEVRENLHNED